MFLRTTNPFAPHLTSLPNCAQSIRQVISFKVLLLIIQFLKKALHGITPRLKSFEEHPVDPSLNPNAKEWDFYFDTEHHRIAVISKRGVSFPQIYNYFTKAFAKASEIMPFDDITVNSITSNEGIELIFALEEIESLTVEVSYSNNDNNEDWEAAIDNQLQEMRAGRIKTTFKAPKKGRMALKSDSFLGGMIKLSKNNGSAKAAEYRDLSIRWKDVITRVRVDKKCTPAELVSIQRACFSVGINPVIKGYSFIGGMVPPAGLKDVEFEKFDIDDMPGASVITIN